ncbi:flavin reductase [Nocardioides sp. WL0053]|uniref:Flavin reductase n=1 Tax=Nocardioides jiangsuensis TaxID=2866161 RepID=A0ABS7RH65_9ACTN|nr:flavin reductase [Nocardioides jiangsuensis]MBY9074383.1 flavin reductase [Nocardioides jiangsuensis]
MQHTPSRSRSVAVVGAGPAGTTLALGLLQHGCAVTLVSDRTAEEIRTGTVMSSQITFESALEVEASLGVTDLLPLSPPLGRMSYDTRRLDGSTAAFAVPLDTPARSVDLRLKVPALLEEIERLGGKVVVRSAGVEDVEDLARTHDLVVVSTGRGGLVQLFETDADHTPYDAPQRVAALTYLTGVEPDPAGPGLRYHSVEGVGECFTCPGLTVGGPCDIFVVEAVPGGPLDVWGDVSSPEEHLARLRDALAEHFPQEAERVRGASLADGNGVLRGSFTPVVRRPVGTLPSGARVLGMADVVVLNDPLTSQGSNNAIKSASFYLEAITAHDGPFDAAWMQRTFDHFWRGWAQWACAWTNSWLRPSEPHQREVVDAAVRHPGVAAQIVAGFDDARLFSPWWFDADAARAFVAEQVATESARFDPRDLRRALGQYATGVTVVTCEDDEGRRWGMTANSFTSVSLNPPLVLWAAAKSSPSLPAFLAADRFAVNVLASDQHHLSRQFSTSGAEKFEGVTLVPADELAEQPGAAAVRPPVLEGTVAHFACRRTDLVDAGDHVVLFGEIEAYDAPGGEPLVFHSGSYRLATKHPDL